MLTKEIFDKEIQNIVEQLVSVYGPEKIILFGSLAEGRIKEGVDRIRQLDTLIKYKLATDFIVYKPEEVKQRLRVGSEITFHFESQL